jgi:hypothetical protein
LAESGIDRDPEEGPRLSSVRSGIHNMAELRMEMAPGEAAAEARGRSDPVWDDDAGFTDFYERRGSPRRIPSPLFDWSART